MTQPEKRIAETQQLLDVLPVNEHSETKMMLRQILENQVTLLRAVKVLLVWDDNE